MIIIDNGHGNPTLLGGKQSPPFSDGSRVFEWDVNRQVVEDLVCLLEKDGIDYHILVPEVKDISLRERVERANHIYESNQDSIFISVHHNAHGYGNEWTDANGYETWYYNESVKGREYAQKMQDSIGQLGRNRGIKEAYKEYTYQGKKYMTKIYVLKYTKMPAILVELGFMTNLNEATKMKSREHIRKAAESIYNGIKTF